MRKHLYGIIGLALAVAATALSPRGTSHAVGGDLIGVSAPSKVAAIAPEQAGKIIDVPVVEGQRVEKNGVLFQLSSRLEELEVARLRPIAEQDLITLRAQAGLRLAEQHESRVRDLRDKQIASESDLEEQQFEVEVAKLRQKQAGIEQAQARNELEQAIERLAQRTVRSPFDGIVTQRMKSEGESIEKFVPVVEVMCLDPLWIEFDCPVQDEHLFVKGNTIEVKPAMLASESRKAEILYVSNKAVASSHTFMVRAAVPNADLSWKTGLKMLITRPVDPTEPAAKPGK
jgi:RND family efflux transporter MFP subunit